MFINLKPGCVGIAGQTFPELLAAAHAAGFGGMDFPLREVTSPAMARDYAGMLADRGMRWGMFPLPRDFMRCDDEQFASGLVELQAQLPLIEAAGCRWTYNHIWPGSDERVFAENWEWHVGRLRRLAACLAEAGAVLGIEWIGPVTLQRTFTHPFIRTPAEAARLVREVDAGVGLAVDCFHCYTSGATLEDLAEAIKGLEVVCVHANDATAGRERDAQLDLERAMPLATGLVDAAGMLSVLDRHGVDCGVFAEPFEPCRSQFADLPTQDVLDEVGANLRQLFEKAGCSLTT